MAMGGTPAVAELVREVAKPATLNDAFTSALARLDELTFSSAVAIRDPLAILVVAEPALLQRNFKRHSFAELATSQTLDAVASKLKPIPLREELLAHSSDELRHSRMFAALATGLTKTTGAQDDGDYELRAVTVFDGPIFTISDGRWT
jgi:hypothetical protein